MADEQKILNGSFKGVPIAIDSSSVTGGRKTSIKQFPSRDTQSVEDLGLQPRSYNLDIIINDKVNQDYFAYRDELLAAIDGSAESGVLIHPLYGRIENIKAITFSISENFGSFGDTVVNVQFEPDNNTGIPTTSGNVVTQIGVSNDNVTSAVNDDVASKFKVTESFTGNFSTAVDKVNEIIAEANTATEFIGETADTLNEFSAEIGELSANVNSLVSDPAALANAVNSLFDSVNGLYSSTTATFETFVGFFGFGGDEQVNQTTAGLVERQKNNEVLDGAVNAQALSYAYLSAVQIEFENTDQIDVVAATLDGQYQTVQASGSTNEVKDNLTDMRVQVLDAFDQARLTTPRILTVETLPTTARLLAFNYYGNDDNGQTIVDLNKINDVSFIEGQVEVLTS